jgi:hypothetical protein
MSIDHRSTDDLPVNLMLNAISIGLNLRKHLSSSLAAYFFDPWWQVLVALNRNEGEITFDDLNIARRNTAVFCFTLAYENPIYRELKVMSEPLNYDVIEEDNTETEIPDIDTDPIEGESEEDRISRLEALYDEYRIETFEKNQEEADDGDEEIVGNLVSELRIFNDQLRDINENICKIQGSKTKHSSKVYIWFLKVSSEIMDDEFSSYSRLLVSQVFSKYEELIATKTWNVDSIHKKIISRIKTLEYRDNDIVDEDWEKEMTKFIRAFKDD